MLARLGREAGIKERLSPHKLRHTFATRSLKYGGNLEYIRIILGHSDIKTTSNAYINVDQADVKAAHQKFSPLSKLMDSFAGEGTTQRQQGQPEGPPGIPEGSPKPGVPKASLSSPIESLSAKQESPREHDVSIGGAEKPRPGGRPDGVENRLKPTCRDLYHEHLRKLAALAGELATDIENGNLERRRHPAKAVLNASFGGVDMVGVYHAQNETAEKVEFDPARVKLSLHDKIRATKRGRCSCSSRRSPQESFYGSYLYDRIVPVDHVLRKINQVVDLSFADEILKDRYNQTIGRPAEDPEFMLRLCLLQYLYGDSDRQVVENARLNLAYKYFLGLAVDAEVPDYTTVSYFRAQRLGEEKFRAILEQIVRQCIDKGLVKGKRQIIDSTPVFANISLSSLSGLVRKCRENVLKTVAKQDTKIAEELGATELQNADAGEVQLQRRGFADRDRSGRHVTGQSHRRARGQEDQANRGTPKGPGAAGKGGCGSG